jgi:hypothetical protein
MSKTITILLIILAAALVSASAVQAQDQPANPPQTQPPAEQVQPPANPPQTQPAAPKESVLKLKVTYKGAEGAVDETHKIWIFVFDQPEFQNGNVMPINAGSIAANGGVASFTLYQSPVYIVVAYDKPGDYDFTGPPASGCPVGMYTKEPPAPAPIALEPGKDTEVEMEFDDTVRMP